jgi:hypothetical protein
MVHLADGHTDHRTEAVTSDPSCCDPINPASFLSSLSQSILLALVFAVGEI